MYINWHPSGDVIAVGNKADDISIIDARRYVVAEKTNFPFQVWRN